MAEYNQRSDSVICLSPTQAGSMVASAVGSVRLEWTL